MAQLKLRRWLVAAMLFCIVRIHAQESLLIGPGDLLHVTILREPDLEQKGRVRDSGMISLALVGDIQVAGLTPAGAADKIAKKYVSGQFLKHPEVSVLVEEYATQAVTVIGQVAKPGAVQLSTPRSLVDVLSMAGGFTEIASRDITIERGGKTENTQHVFVPNDPKDAGGAEVVISPGDTVIVPKAGIVYVLGDVGRPGGYVMQNDSRLSALEAISLAAGANKTASDKHIRLIRKVGGKYTERDLPFRAMEDGKQPDVQLEAGDVLYVPFSLAKHMTLGATSVAASASSALIYASH